MSLKRQFIASYLSNAYSVAELCKCYSISRKTGYYWINKYQKEGEQCFKEGSKRPHFSPNKTPDLIEQLILSVRDKHPRWGGVKIEAYLLNLGMTDVPSYKTINSILKRHGRITELESEKHKAWIRFEHEQPNDLWQIDFKGHFALNDKSRCYPLTILDDHSRYVFLIKACTNQTKETVQQHLIRLFRNVGLPKRMTMDNGTPWGYSGDQLYTKFSAWLIRLGIIVTHSRPNHPQTQGKLERFHRTFKEELLSHYSFDSLSDAQEGFDWWLNCYNTERPHAALGMKTPVKRYKTSDTPYLEQLPPIEYPTNLEVRKVQQKGVIFYKGRVYRIGDAFRGEPVAIKLKDNDLASIYYCNQKVLTLDLKNYCV